MSLMESILQHCIVRLPPLDGDYADTYNNLYAAHEYELCTVFEAVSEVDTDSAVLEDFMLLNTPVD